MARVTQKSHPSRIRQVPARLILYGDYAQWETTGNPASCVTVSFTIGDPSGSASERWEMHITEVVSGKTIIHCDEYFGTPCTKEYALVKGKTYTFTVKWVASNLDDPDYDWCCLINGSDATGLRQGLNNTGTFTVEDPDSLLTEETHGNDYNITIGKKGKIIVHGTVSGPVPKLGVEWETHGDNTPLDVCPKNDGKRIFPDKKTPTDSNATARKKVTVKATVTPAMANQTVYFRVFDVDDPSTDSIIDPNGPAGGDNRGTGHALSATSAQTDSSGYASAEFTVSMQPGDNFKVFASLNNSALNALTQNQVDADSIPATIAQSEMLTVWRRLWLEFDSMGPVATTGAEKNFEEGVIASVQQNVPSAGKSTLNVGMRLQDDVNRYEDGCIVIDGTTYMVLSNTDNLIFSDEVVVNGLVPPSAAGKAFAIYDDDYDPATLAVRCPLPYALSGGELIESAFADAYIKPTPAPPEYIRLLPR